MCEVFKIVLNHDTIDFGIHGANKIRYFGGMDCFKPEIKAQYPLLAYRVLSGSQILGGH